MFIAVAQLLSNEPEVGNGITIQVLLRSVIFAVLVYVVVKMHRGNNWALIVLTILLGEIGTVTLMIDPIIWLFEGNSFDRVFTGMTIYSGLFGIGRIVHLVSVITALILMYRPAANFKQYAI